MHINRITMTTLPKSADHGLQQDLSTVSLFFNVINQILGLLEK